MYERVARENSELKSETLRWWKVIYCAVMFLFNLTASMIFTELHIVEPGFNLYASSRTAYYGMWIFVSVVEGGALAFVIIASVFVVRSWNGKLIRHKNFLVLSTVFIISIFVMLFAGGGRYI
jgi:hypothetical protein